MSRNEEFLCLEGPTGKSGVDFTVLCAYHHCKSVLVERQAAAAEALVKARYQTYVDALKLDARIKHEVEVFPVSSNLGTGEETEEEWAYLAALHHFVGVLVIFRKASA